MTTKILSGMRPTGRLHIGHFVGALENWTELQEEYDSYYFYKRGRTKEKLLYN